MSSGLADQPRRARGNAGRDRDRVGKIEEASEKHTRQEWIKNRNREGVRERGDPMQVGVGPGAARAGRMLVRAGGGARPGRHGAQARPVG